MDGRRHSVDIPISRTLIALRRVKSLRDPSTNSMSKLSSLVDNLNWETNSNNAITLGFDNTFQNGTNDSNAQESRSSTRFREDEQPVSDHELYYGSKHCNTKGDDYCDDYDDKGSCDEGDEISTRNEKRRNGGSNCNIWHRNHDESSISETRNERWAREVSLYKNDENVGFMGSCHQGCGISSCWSRTKKFRDSNISPNVEERLLLLNGENPYLESSPRNLCEKLMPRSFSELVGQSTVADSLLHAISNRRISSLYLFHGPRGTGKTSASRIFAAALNCLSPSIADKPCGSCGECGLFFSGRSRDFKEVDPLRINKTERCKSLVRGAWAPPVSSRFKVYVIDECHLLHRGTWGILLSGVDELPRNVVFIMVTSDIDKVPRSVVSRSRGYRFQRVREVDMVERLGRICVEEGLEFEDDALNFIANKSNGSLRDAEMMLDQMSLLGKKITVSLVYEVNGVVSNDELLDLLNLALSADASNTVKMARELMRSRIEPLQLVSQLANLIMDILAGKLPDDVSEVKRKLFGTDNSEADMHQLSHALRMLSQTEKQLRTSKNQTTWLTVALLQLSSAGSSHDMNDARLSTRTLNPPEGDFHSTLSTGESLKCSVACACEEDEPEKIGTKDDKEGLELVWSRAIGICTPRSFKKFLRKRGKLVSINLMHGTAVAELEFDRPDYVTKAEKSWKVIAGALQHMLGHNVELRINLANKYVETCSSECGSQTMHTCCHGKELLKTIRSKDGNALSIGTSTPNMARDEKSGVVMWNERVNKGCPNSISIKRESKSGGSKECSKFRCWKAATFPFRKVWQMRHQPRSERFVDYALYCAAAK